MRKGQRGVHGILKPGERKCARCSAIHPETEQYFSRYGQRRFKRICKDCEATEAPPEFVTPSVIVDYKRQCVVQTIPFSRFSKGVPRPETLIIMQMKGVKVEVLK